jgi:class 3 adenylate cyclase/tetratricopeptide (TPR) repeat protein
VRAVVSASTPDDETEPELRRVSVLFADIQGSTALIQHLDPEQAADLIDPVLRVMIEAVERHDGLVNSRGDGILAIFGAPSAAEDHALRACLAALAMREALGANDRVRIRVGIHTGDAVIRRVRHGRGWTQDAVGVSVHIAARLEQTAEAGTICLSDAVWQLVHGFVQATPLEPIPAKGIDAPLARYLLLEAERTANPWGVRAAKGLHGFVDRTRERATLQRALAGERLRVVQLVGAPGMGKSRLAHEFLRTPDARARRLVSLFGDRHRRSVPFHPVAAWLREWLGIRAADARVEARRKLEAGLAGLRLPISVTPDLFARMLGLGAAGRALGADEMRRVDFGAAFAALATAIAGRQRLLLLVEDLDCLDDASRELFESALRHLAADDVLVLTTSRARVRLPSVPATAARALMLAPLGAEDSATLLAHIDTALAGNAALAGAILRKAGGNPLFLEEVAPLAVNDAEAITIPDRVEALIADRLARLPRPLKRLVQLCAMIGVDVSLPLLARLADESPDEIFARLNRLQSEQLLYESRKYPDPQFSFKHALTRDVAYRSILAARRRAHHARIVEILENAPPEEQERDLDDLCQHAIQAHLLGKAVGLLQRAANKAAARGAYQVAAAHLERAREIAASLPDDAGAARLDVVMGLQVLRGWANDYAALEELLDEAEPLARRLGNRVQEVRIQALRVHLFNITGRLSEAAALGEQAVAAARAVGNVALVLLAGHYLGQTYFNLGRFADAVAVLTHNLEAIAAAVGAPSPAGSTLVASLQHGSAAHSAVMSHGTRAMALAFRGDHAPAAADVAQARRLAESIDRSYARIFVHGVAGLCELHRRDAGAAEAACRAGIELAEKEGIQQLTPPLLCGLGHALLLAGKGREAAEYLSEAHRQARATQRTMFQISAAAGLAFTSLHLDEPDLSRTFADEAVALAREYGFRGVAVQALRAQGLVLAADASTEAEGRGVLNEALRLANELEMRAEVAHCRAALAVADPDDAAMHRAIAARLYAELGMSCWFERLRPAFAAGRMWYP